MCPFHFTVFVFILEDNMLRKAGLFSWLVVFLFMLFPAIAMAGGLKLEDVELPKEGTAAQDANLSVYFDLRGGDNSTIVGVAPENCQLSIGDKKFDITSETGQIKNFVDGDKNVGILIIFPKGKAYTEEDYGLRENIGICFSDSRIVRMTRSMPFRSTPALRCSDGRIPRICSSSNSSRKKSRTRMLRRQTSFLRLTPRSPRSKA